MRWLTPSTSNLWSVLSPRVMGLALAVGTAACGGSGDEASIFSAGEAGEEESSADTDADETGPKLDMDDGGLVVEAHLAMGTEENIAADRYEDPKHGPS